MTEIFLDRPEVSGDTVVYRWRVEPASTLYRQSTYYLRFPSHVDLSRVPESIFWLAGLMCLHAHWCVLRPCRVHLPVRLRPGHRQTWERLLDAEIATIETYRGGSDFEPIQIFEEGPELDDAVPLPDLGRAGTAFSGGKDSLLQAGLLTELSDRPLLVAVTSPMPPLKDHETTRRQFIFQEIVRRRDVTFVEVQSDFRATWDNGFPLITLGVPISINEITDTFLYTAALLISGYAFGVTHLFLASEAEVQENVLLDGRVIQHPHFMYSVATQRVLESLLLEDGFRYCSLTSPLRSRQVQQLLWRRYGDLSDLQYSCWRVGADEATCSRCTQCLRIAFCALAMGEDPSRMGIDLATLVSEQREWVPNSAVPRGVVLPGDTVKRALHAETARFIRDTSLITFLRSLTRGNLLRLAGGALRGAVRDFLALRRSMSRLSLGEPSGYRRMYFDFVDELLREKLASIYSECFHEESFASYRHNHRGTAELSSWVTEPLRNARARGGERLEAVAR